MEAQFQNKVVVITGGATGIGLEAAKRFVTEGAFVFITGRRQELLDKVVKEIGSNIRAVNADSGRREDVEWLFKIVEEEKGQIDILLSNAGTGGFGFPIGGITEEHYERVFDTNIRGSILTVQGALPLLKDGGAIVLTGSISSVKSYETMSVYCASKAALRTFSKIWAIELKSRKIRINIVSPGPTETAQLTDLSKELQDQVVAPIPLGRAGKSEDIVNAITFLASEKASFITGTEMFVDGGASLV
ncbi:NAD(P)-dependent dehydrogenase (short-subunit alcohol dehydrogenase family) [Flavobacterium sp. W4I14]|nr:NAD(P)-dependent dehydrogenase (short-subunit alcohol dehydrogenase family) [Flavobacterium sp. W4I14]